MSRTAVLAVAVLTAGALAAAPAGADVAPGPAYEVWTIDQTGSRTAVNGDDYGGYLHIYDGAHLEAGADSARAETIDLGGAASDLCRARTGALPRRPHMLVWNGGETHAPGAARYAVIAWVLTGHVLVLDADTREPVECLRSSPGWAGNRQAHAVWPTPDGRHLLVANQNGKLLERIRTDWVNAEFAFEPEATLSLYEGTTPAGDPVQDTDLRPDNAPICTRVTDDGRFTFVSLRGGGAFVVDHSAEPMQIVAEYDRSAIGDNGCGQAPVRTKMYLNAGAGGPGRTSAHEVFALDLTEFGSEPALEPNTPRATPVYARGEGHYDAHGLAVTHDGRYLLAGDRAANDVTVVDTRTDDVVGRYALTGPASADPAPDLFDLSPRGDVLFTSLRGPMPLSGGHDAIGSTPGIGVVRLEDGGVGGALAGVAPAPRPDARPADTHAIGVRVAG